jgi:hypothetical protein
VKVPAAVGVATVHVDGKAPSRASSLPKDALPSAPSSSNTTKSSVRMPTPHVQGRHDADAGRPRRPPRRRPRAALHSTTRR